ncbi:MAG: hypothetical protein IJ728_12100 [Selenomonadaceae bacterium]|nr:hypothetical protein [Selenomonadaceae bacterium]
MANISNSKSNTLITGSSGADSIKNSAGANYVTIESGGGNDYIKNGEKIGTDSPTLNANYIKINAGSGNDYIYSAGDYNTILAETGDDTIIVDAYHYVDAGDGNDSVDAGYGVTTVYGGTGNDTIISGYNNRVYINGGKGNDYIFSDAWKSTLITPITIEAGEGNDTISFKKTSQNNNGYGIIKYKSGDGDDTILNFSENSTLNIVDKSKYSTVYSDNDVIINMVSGSMTLKDVKGTTLNIVGGTYDSTSSTGVTIDNSTANTLISGTSYGDSIKNESVAGGVTIESGSGNDTVANYAARVTIKSGVGNDSIYNYANYTRIDAGDGSDTIRAYGNYISVNAGVGNDYISSSSFDNGSTYEGGLGNDTIYMPSSEGDDTLKYSNGDGDDFIQYYQSFHAINIASGSINNVTGSGNDVVLKVGSGSMTLKDTKNLPLHIKNSNGTDSVVVYNGTNTIAPIYNITSWSSLNGTSSSEYLFNKGRSSTVNAAAGNDTIYNVGNYVSINGGAGNDSIVNVVNRGWGSTFAGGLGNDTIVLHNSQHSIIDYVNGDGDDVIVGLNWDSIRITEGSYTSLISGNDIVLKIGSGSITLKDEKGYENRFTVIGNLATLPAGLIYNTNETALTANNKFTGSEIDLNEFVSTVVTLDASSAKNAQNLIGNSNSNLIKGSVKNDTLAGGAGDDTLIGGKGNDVFIYDGQGDDVITDYTADQDTVMIADDQSITGSKISGKDVILTVGDSSSDSIGNLTLKNAKGKVVKITKSTNTTSIPVIYGDGSATISIATNDSSLFTYSNDTIHKYGLITAIDATKAAKDKRITNNYYISMTMNGGSKNDTLFGDYGNDTLNGNAGNDSLNGDSGNDILNGGVGNDTLYGGYGKDELTGGKGKDVFIASRGDDIITDYKTGEDSIKFSGATIKNIEYVGELNTDLRLFFVEGGTLTIENAISIKSSRGKAIRTPQLIKIIDTDGNVTSQSYQLGTINTLAGANTADTISGFSTNDLLIGGKGKDVFIYGSGHDTISDYIVNQDSIILNLGNANDYSINGSDVIIPIDDDNSLTIQNAKAKKVKINNVDITFDDQVNVTLDNKSTTPYTATDKAMTIDASKRTKAIKITANDNDNTINGGKGNDTLTGGLGADVFKYNSGNGNDIITDYSASEGDLIRLGKKAEVTAATFKNNDLILTVGKNNKITVQGGATQAVTVINNNGVKMTYEKWSESIGFEERYFSDDNFATDDLNEIISSESDLISGDLDLNTNNFAQTDQIVQVNYQKKK